MYKKILPVVLIGLISLYLSACDEPSASLKVQVGEKMPPFALHDLHQSPVVLQPSPGKLLMINVWATWCAPCRHEMPSLQRMAANIGADRLTLIGLSIDTNDHVAREFLIERKITFPSLIDKDSVVVDGVLGVRVFPSTFFIRPDGTLVKVIEGWRDWDSPELLADIRRLLPAGNNLDTDKP